MNILINVVFNEDSNAVYYTCLQTELGPKIFIFHVVGTQHQEDVLLFLINSDESLVLRFRTRDRSRPLGEG